MKKFASVLTASLLLLSSVCLSSCSDESEKDILKNAVEITLNGSTAECDSDAVYVNDDGKITITRAGTYSVTGTLDDGWIYVECVDAGEFDLVLNNANITNSDGSCIVIKKAQEAVITLYEGSVNTLTDGSSYKFDNPADDEPDSVIFSKEDLVINGEGKLVVDANYAGAIYSKDGLKIESGEFELDSVKHAIKGKDYLVINGGSFNIHALGDGLKSTNYDSSLVGYVEINGGNISIYSEDEAIQAVSGITVNGGEITIRSLNNGIKCVGGLYFLGGNVNIDAQDNPLDGAELQHDPACSILIDGIPYEG